MKCEETKCNTFVLVVTRQKARDGMRRKSQKNNRVCRHHDHCATVVTTYFR